jgi:hypothetical protein
MTMTDQQQTLTFQTPPSGIVTFQKGQMDYAKKTSIRLKRNTKHGIHFRSKNRNLYIQDKNDGKIFHLQMEKR